MAGDRAFENQFQWEVDRWVFRHRQGGEPIEITSDERDRLLALHRSRMARGTRSLGALLLVALVLCWPTYLYVVPIVYVGAILLGMPLLTRWAYTDVAKQIRGKPLLGIQLGVAGRMARRTNAVSARSLLISLLWLGAVGALFIVDFSGPTYAGPYWMVLASYGMIAATFILLAWMIVLKWAQSERDRLSKDKALAVRRARDLR